MDAYQGRLCLHGETHEINVYCISFHFVSTCILYKFFGFRPYILNAPLFLFCYGFTWVLAPFPPKSEIFCSETPNKFISK